MRARSLLKDKVIDVSGRVSWGVPVDLGEGQANIEVNELSKLLRVPEQEGVVFRSGMDGDGYPLNEELGRFSVIGPTPALHIQYDVNSRRVSIYTLDQRNKALYRIQAPPTAFSITDIWAYVKGFMGPLQCEGGCSSVPFWGGLMGYVSYEAGLEGISVNPPRTMQTTAPTTSNRPDVLFALMTRSIVIDHSLNKIYVQSLQKDDDLWISNTAGVVAKFISDLKATQVRPRSCCCMTAQGKYRNRTDVPRNAKWANEVCVPGGPTDENTSNPRPWEPKLPVAKPSKLHPLLVTAGHQGSLSKNGPRTPGYQWCSYLVDLVPPKAPDYVEYATKILECEQAIREGSSYELCLTNQIKLLTPSSGCPESSGWLLFEALCSTNPAPFSAFLRLCSLSDAVTIVSSSPERFLSWTRSGDCEFRPIKGTVKRGSWYFPRRCGCYPQLVQGAC